MVQEISQHKEDEERTRLLEMETRVSSHPFLGKLFVSINTIYRTKLEKLDV